LPEKLLGLTRLEIFKGEEQTDSTGEPLTSGKLILTLHVLDIKDELEVASVHCSPSLKSLISEFLASTVDWDK
jgi:hypothetical protein